MRKLMWFTVGFAAACVVGAYVLQGAALYIIAACLFAPAVAGFILLRNSPRLRSAALTLAGLAVGLTVWQSYDDAYLTHAKAVDGQTMPLSIAATDYSFDNDYGVTVDGAVRLQGKEYTVRCYIHDNVPIMPGQRIEGDFRLRYTGTEGLSGKTYHSGEGIFLLAYSAGEHRITGGQKLGWRHVPAFLRKESLQRIEAIFPEDAVAFVKALLLGDTSDLNYMEDTHLKLSGIRHVVAVSGLHVSILFSAVYWLAGKRRGLSALLGIPVLLLFAAMAGFSPSILRACIMQLLMLLALLFKREYDPPTALSFAVLTMLTVNPQTVTSVGFQLSVASVAGIFLFSQRMRQWLLDPKRLGRVKGRSFFTRLVHGAAASVSITIGAMVTTTPLCAWYFGSVSLISILTNLLCLWVVTFLFCGIIVACLLSLVWLPLAGALAWILAWPVRYILGVSAVLSQFPLAAVYTESIYICLWLGFCYVLLGIYFLGKQKRPLVLSCCAFLSLSIALLAGWSEPLLDSYRVTVLDVGQGQCVLLQSHGRTYMVDCGGDYDEGAADTAAAHLHSQGVFRLDGLILTHYDRDHVGAAAYLMSRVPVGQLILPQTVDDGQWEQTLLQAHGNEPVYAEEDLQIRWEDAYLTVYASQDHATSNESSLCVLFHTEKCDILITGDRSQTGEVKLLADHRLPDLDALIVGHHGAASSTGTLLLEKTKPEVAIISVGEANRYGHPSEAVLDRLHNYGCLVRRTDLEGTIILRG